ncbi:hypothetical protein J6590_024556 [Homalodisca vitripennis]|nr:hypothetical protein J6590_024556 [Homalodisca vitripennis]
MIVHIYFPSILFHLCLKEIDQIPIIYNDKPTTEKCNLNNSLMSCRYNKRDMRRNCMNESNVVVLSVMTLPHLAKSLNPPPTILTRSSGPSTHTPPPTTSSPKFLEVDTSFCFNYLDYGCLKAKMGNKGDVRHALPLQHHLLLCVRPPPPTTTHPPTPAPYSPNYCATHNPPE